MNFMQIAENRQSCRSYDSAKEIETEKLDAILRAAQLAPSACNGQPYKITVCTGDTAKSVAFQPAERPALCHSGDCTFHGRLCFLRGCIDRRPCQGHL